MENWQVAILVLVALVVGLLVPVLVQLRSVLRELRGELRGASERLGPALEDARISAQRIRLVTDGLDGNEAAVGELVRSAGDLARTLDRLRTTSHVATAVAAATAAGVRAFRDFRHDNSGADETVSGSQEAPQHPSPMTSDFIPRKREYQQEMKS